MQVVDSHSHFFGRSFFQALAEESPLEGTTDEKLQRLTRAGWSTAIVPDAQVLQVRSLVVLPAAAMNSPATHVVKGVHSAAFVSVENDPDAHAEQVRSLVAPPSALTKLPAEHSVRATQAVAGSASSSQVSSPSSQAAAGAVSPAQN